VKQPPCLDKALSGDRAALEELARTCWPAAFGYLARLSGSRELARELAQETMARMFGSLQDYRPRAGAGFMSWVFRIARNLYVDHLRRSGRETLLPEGGGNAEQPVEGDPTGLAALALAEAGELRRALSRLSVGDRELIVLRYWFGFSHREAARATGATPALVKSRLNAALARLRRQYAICGKELPHEKPRA
jgi:RNA polymerase sigma-70 factor (ECF subfamily)